MENFHDVEYSLMTKFNWTPNEIDNILIPTIQRILDYMREEQRIHEREMRLSKLKNKRRK